MDIQQEKQEKHTIQAYSDTEVRVNNQCYSNDLIINATQIIPWEISSHQPLTATELMPLLTLNAEIILIGYIKPISIENTLRNELLSQRIGLECMRLDAACRTFNVLLNESRHVALGLIF